MNHDEGGSAIEGGSGLLSRAAVSLPLVQVWSGRCESKRAAALIRSIHIHRPFIHLLLQLSFVHRRQRKRIHRHALVLHSCRCIRLSCLERQRRLCMVHWGRSEIELWRFLIHMRLISTAVTESEIGSWMWKRRADVRLLRLGTWRFKSAMGYKNVPHGFRSLV